MTSAVREPSIADQLAALERYLRREIPSALRDVYMSGKARAYGLLPLATGFESDLPRTSGSNVEQFLDARERFASVLGNAIGNSDLSRVEDHVWPPSLLVVEDAGCAIYRAVDLDDPRLRVIEYEHFDPVEDPDAVAGTSRVAFREPLVPRNLQHRFIVVSDSFDDWLALKETPRSH